MESLFCDVILSTCSSFAFILLWKKAGCFTIIVFSLSCNCVLCLFLEVWCVVSVIYDCGIY